MLTSKGYGVLKKNIKVNEVINTLTVAPRSDFMQSNDDDSFCVCLETLNICMCLNFTDCKHTELLTHTKLRNRNRFP